MAASLTLFKNDNVTTTDTATTLIGNVFSHPVEPQIITKAVTDTTRKLAKMVDRSQDWKRGNR